MAFPTLSNSAECHLVMFGKEVSGVFGSDTLRRITSFEWRAGVNSGYSINVRVNDPYLHFLKSSGIINQYLDNTRKDPIEVQFKLSWAGTENTTKVHIAYLTDLSLYGSRANDAYFEFIAIDPPSWYLNAGNGSGKVFTGKISKVIGDVIKEYSDGKISSEITETNDSPDGKWAMMRQDPRTFIQSLLEWSSSLTDKKTNWMVFSNDEKIVVKQQHDLKPALLETFKGYNTGGVNVIREFAALTESYITALQSRTITHGISSLTGQWLDPISNNKTIVDDSKTSSKLNVKTSQVQGTSKSNQLYSTSISSLPEFSGGELGIKYEDWVDGRARNWFLNLLQMTMMMKLTVIGNHKFDDPTKLGVGYIDIQWKDTSSEDFILSGKWLVNGFKHYFDGRDWSTSLDLYRLDRDAAAELVTG